MNKNESLFKILDHMFPGEFAHSGTGKFTYIFWTPQTPDKKLQPDISLDDAFWLADKTGLFDEGMAFGKNGKVWGLYNRDYTQVSIGVTPQEAIVKAIIAIHGKKE